MSHVWSFSPELETYADRQVYSPYRPREKQKPDVWIAPEHGKVAVGMRRDFPRDERGLPIKGRKKELVLDKRPNLLVPPRPTRRLYL